MNANATLKVTMKNEQTALLRILRIVNRQGIFLNKCVIEPKNNFLELSVSLDNQDQPLQLVKLLQKQVAVLEVSVQNSEIPVAV